MAPTTSPPRVCPSVPPADFSHFSRPGEESRPLEKAGADRIQPDVMDGPLVSDTAFAVTVGPRSGGRAYPGSTAAKIAETRAMTARPGREIELKVDGGIGRDTVGGAARAGAATFCVGGALSREHDRMADDVTTPRLLAAASAPQDTQAYRLQENIEEAA
jgi:pentose-5-phosphate-3-epimerase